VVFSPGGDLLRSLYSARFVYNYAFFMHARRVFCVYFVSFSLSFGYV
jgi:hypothetical protein